MAINVEAAAALSHVCSCTGFESFLTTEFGMFLQGATRGRRHGCVGGTGCGRHAALTQHLTGTGPSLIRCPYCVCIRVVYVWIMMHRCCNKWFSLQLVHTTSRTHRHIHPPAKALLGTLPAVCPCRSVLWLWLTSPTVSTSHVHPMKTTRHAAENRRMLPHGRTPACCVAAPTARIPYHDHIPYHDCVPYSTMIYVNLPYFLMCPQSASLAFSVVDGRAVYATTGSPHPSDIETAVTWLLNEPLPALFTSE